MSTGKLDLDLPARFDWPRLFHTDALNNLNREETWNLHRRLRPPPVQTVDHVAT